MMITTGLKRFCIVLLLMVPLVGIAQTEVNKIKTEEDTTAVATDSTIHILLKPVYILPEKKDMNKKQLRQYTQLELKVKKVYPIAKVAAVKLTEYNRVYSSFKTERERKNYIKQVERDLFSEFENELRAMKVSEGRILIKLLDRETGSSSFEIIKEFKGGFSAFFWQSVAKLFGHDLKDEYDPVTEDRLIEYIIMQIDLGLI